MLSFLSAILAQIEHVPLLLGAAILAGMIRGFAGFGSGMLLAPLLVALYGPAIAVPVVLLVEVGISLPLLPSALRRADWARVGRLSLTALLGAPMGMTLLLWLPVSLAPLLVSAVVLLFVIAMLVQRDKTAQPWRGADWLAGAASGLFGGLSGMTGPPVVMLLLRGGHAASRVRATLISYFLVIDAALVALFAFDSGLQSRWIEMAVVILLPMIVGAWLGARLFPLASEQLFRRVALTLVAMAALIAPLS